MKKTVGHNQLNNEQTSARSDLWSNLNYLLGRRTKQKTMEILKGHCHDKAHVRSWLTPFFVNQ